MLDQLRALWTTQPALVISILTALVVAAAAAFGVVIDEQSAGKTIALIVPILLGGVATRSRVSPAAPNVGPDSDSLLPDPPEDA